MPSALELRRCRRKWRCWPFVKWRSQTIKRRPMAITTVGRTDTTTDSMAGRVWYSSTAGLGLEGSVVVLTAILVLDSLSVGLAAILDLDNLIVGSSDTTTDSVLSDRLRDCFLTDFL